MKIVTFNIRYDCDQDGINCFSFRKAGILKKLKEEKPDIICFQEVTPHVAVWLKESLSEYYVVGCPRSKNLESEQMSVAFRRDRYNLMKMDTCWLSETPWIPGSRYPGQSECSRTYTEVVLQELDTRLVFRLINTHLDYNANAQGSAVRVREVEQILAALDGAEFFPEAPAIVTGDFNAAPESPEVRLLEQHPGFINAAKGIGNTYHGFGTCDRDCIDYIFAKGFFCTKLEKWTDEKDGVYLSDHYPVCAELSVSGAG